VTKFDIIVFGLLFISAGVGFVRGAAREIAAMFALVAAAALAIFGLPFSAPLARQFVSAPWLAAVAALIVVFLVTYIVLRLVGAGVARQIQQTHVLGALDRTVGLLIGLVRGLVVLGALNLMFGAATPPDLQPKWILESRTWPLSQNMGQFLRSLAPGGLDIAGRLRPAFERAVTEGSGDRTATDRYDARQRGEIDDLEEKSQ
jgi:membrane protein required for colicin V production